MTIPYRVTNEIELHRNNGNDGSRKWIAYDSSVYDVNNCPKWRLEMRERLRFPGQDLTSELTDAPHKEDVFTWPCVKVVGRLEESDFLICSRGDPPGRNKILQQT